MPKKENTVVSTDLTAVREIDFVSRFTRGIAVLRDILGSIRLEQHEPGTQLKAKSAVVALNTGVVGEGEEIPYNEVVYEEHNVGVLNWDKQSIGVSLEAISAHGYDAAVQMADDDMLYRLRGKIVTNFINFAQTGTLVPAGTIDGFQMALAEAQGQVQNKWENMDKGYSEIIGFANVLDAYRYLGAANISVQTQFGLNYLENFLGFSRLFLTSKIPSGTIVATPAENIVLYYVDASSNDFSRAGFQFRTDGEENLIAVHVEGNHKTMVSELTTVTGMGLFAEYLDGIAVVPFGNGSGLKNPTVAPESAATTLFDELVSNMQSGITVAQNAISGSLKFIEGGLAQSGPLAGDGHFLALKFTNLDSAATSVKVGLRPSMGTGLVEIITDPDKNGVFKITSNTQVFEVVSTSAAGKVTTVYDLSGLILEDAGV